MNVDLSHEQLKKLHNEKTITLEHHQIGHGGHDLSSASKHVINKISKAFRNGTGVRLSHEDFHGTGIISGLKRLGHKMGMSNGDERSLGGFAQNCILRPFMKGARAQVTNLSTQAPGMIANQLAQNSGNSGFVPLASNTTQPVAYSSGPASGETGEGFRRRHSHNPYLGGSFAMSGGSFTGGSFDGVGVCMPRRLSQHHDGYTHKMCHHCGR